MILPLIEQEGLHATINTTEDCNLRCKYCYEINKKPKSIDFEYCKKFIDDLINDDDPCGANIDDSDYFKNLPKDGIIIDFIGGDALIDVKLLDKVINYFIMKVNTTDTQNARYWRNKYRFSISSNGTLFTDEVKRFCEKWQKILSIEVSIDGCPEIHDMNRVFPDGTGSMSKILEDWKWYKKTFPYDSRTTKATMSKNTIPYLYESLKFMHEDLGLVYISQNFIMENAYLTEEDLHMFEDQMKLCVQYVLEHQDNLYYRPFDNVEFAAHKLSEGDFFYKAGHCGSGSMPCLGIDGNYYPCFRWLPHTQSSYQSPIMVGNVKDGFNNKQGFVDVRHGAYRCNCSEEKCKNCKYESACSYCIAGCYSEFGCFKRATYICDITKIQCKYAKIYWNEFTKMRGGQIQYPEEFSINGSQWNNYHKIGEDDC